MAESDYENFDLTLVPRAGGGYTVKAKSFRGDSEVPIADWPFTESQIADLRAVLGGPARDAKRASQSVAAATQDYAAKVRLFGEVLFDTVFSGDTKTNLLLSLEKAQNDLHLAGLRIRLCLDEVPEIADLPWEYLYRRDKRRFLSIFRETPIVRYMRLLPAPIAQTVDLPIRVLVMIADPTDLVRLDSDLEMDNIKEAFAELEEKGLAEVDSVVPATLSELKDRLALPAKYHVFHFIGHGDFDPATGEGVLCIEDDNGKSKKINATDLVVAMDHPSLRLAVLNSCEGAQTGTRDPFAGVAQGLVLNGIPATIAMQFRITDKAAILLAKEFYRYLVRLNYPIDRALVEARKALYDQNPTEWGTPVLFLGTEHGAIFDIPSEEQRLQLEIKALADDAKAAIDRADYPGALEKLQDILSKL
jgi:hypothetical protein